MLFFSRSHHFSILSASLSCFSAPLLFPVSSPLLASSCICNMGTRGISPSRLVGAAARAWVGRASGRRPSAVGPSIRTTRLHVSPSCNRPRLVWFSFNRGCRSRRVVAICVRCICTAAAAHAAVECRAAAWGAGRGGGCATITVTHSIRTSRASRAYSTASRGATTTTATGRTTTGAVGSRHSGDGCTRQQ